MGNPNVQRQTQHTQTPFNPKGYTSCSQDQVLRRTWDRTKSAFHRRRLPSSCRRTFYTCAHTLSEGGIGAYLPSWPAGNHHHRRPGGRSLHHLWLFYYLPHIKTIPVHSSSNRKKDRGIHASQHLWRHFSTIESVIVRE